MWGHRDIKMWSLVFVTLKNLGYDNPRFIISYYNKKYTLIFCDLKDANVGIKSVDSVCFVEAPGRPSR